MLSLKKIIASSLIVLLIISITCIMHTNQLILQGEVDTKSIDLSSKITGRVKSIPVKEGDIVKAGDILLILDTPDIVAKNDQAKAAVEIARAKKLKIDNGVRAEDRKMREDALHQAESTLEMTRKKYERMKKLRIQNCISIQEFEKIEADYKNALKQKDIAQENLNMANKGERFEEKMLAEAALKQAENTQRETQSYLDENIIRSPISGQVKEITVDEGELVSAGYTLATVVDTSDNWIVLNLREDLISKIKIGSEFDVKIPALNNKLVRAKVYYISAMGNFSAWRATKIRGDFDLKTFEIRARPLNRVEGMIAGMSAVVDWNNIKNEE